MPNGWHRQITPYQASPDTPYHDKQRRNSAASTLLSDPTHISMNVEMLSRLLIVAPVMQPLSVVHVGKPGRPKSYRGTVDVLRANNPSRPPARTAPVSCRVGERSSVVVPSLRMRHHDAV